MGQPISVRFSDTDRTAIENDMKLNPAVNSLNDEIVYLVRLGLEEAEWQRGILQDAKRARHGTLGPAAEDETSRLPRASFEEDGSKTNNQRKGRR